MAFKSTRPTPPTGANVAKSINVGTAPEEVAADLSYLDKTVETVPEGFVGDAPPLVESEPAAQPAPENSGTAAVDEDAEALEDPRFKGKSVKDVLQAYKNLESEVGRHRNEVGETRKAMDALILRQAQGQPQPAAQTAPATTEVNESELLSQLLTSPSKVLNQMEERALRRFQGQETERLVNQIKQENVHLVSDPNFQEYIRTVPQSILQATNTDPQQLMFVINQYKQLNPASRATSAPQPAQKPSNHREVEIGVAAGTGPSGRQGPKVWKRSEIRNLINSNEPAYRQALPEIEAAYRDGRVINDK